MSRTLRLKGLVVHSGIYIGRARFQERKEQQIPSRQVKESDLDAEITSLQNSLNHIDAELNNILDNQNLTETERDILHSHLLILRDPEIEKELLHTIESLKYSAAAAVHAVYSKICSQFREMDNEYFMERLDDYKDVSRRIIDHILNHGKSEPTLWTDKDIAIFEDISPSQVSSYARTGLRAYCCVNGSYNSHASILSRALGLVSMVSVENLTDQLEEGQELILDAQEGVLISNPNPETMAIYKRKVTELERRNQILESISNNPSVTANNIKLDLMTNIELPEELDLVLKLNPDGIGLFRTEFLYLDRNSLPTEHEQYLVYKKLAESLAPRPITIRTFDLGGDKLSHLIPGQEEMNPYLGSRGIRFSLSHPQLFETQIRAILRASIHGNIRIMFPMIVDAQDFLQAKAFVQELMKKMQIEGISFRSDIELGAMVEIPSAAIMANDLAQACDFLSIGTNDLVQYTLATDRNNDQVADYYIQHHPAVLKLISCCIEASEKHQKSLSVCGEMASIPRYIPLLFGMGIRAFSINPHQFLSAKQQLCSTDQSTMELMQGFDPCQSRELTEELLVKLTPASNKE